MISLLTNIGSAAKGIFGSPNFGSVMGLLGSITRGLGDYQTSRYEIDQGDAMDAINQAYQGQLMARKVRDMVGGATEAYGQGLLKSVRAGGTMPNYTSRMWQSVSDGMEDYGADLRAMALNAKIRQASFASQQGANRMKLISSIVDSMRNAYDGISSRVPSSSSSSPAGVAKGSSSTNFSMARKKRMGGG
jgi:hypothetical protein